MTTPSSLRRTFAIISHPDAGKTTLTEKLLLFGGAIHLAGAVKAKKGGKSATSDWMAIEQQRGISVTASVMTFEYNGKTINLLDTPGHKDFSEDTYRTLTAVDSAVMVLDGAKGIEEQTYKLFEVCRLRDTPITTFINKMDRETREPFELLDEIESRLQLSVCPITWPIGMGERFRGCYNLITDTLYLFDDTGGAVITDGKPYQGANDPALDDVIPVAELTKFREEVAMVKAIYPAFDREHFLEGHMTPVFFGSAINNFGVRELLEAICEFAPPPRLQKTDTREVAPQEPKFTGFVFKIQANMDKNHRDRIAFVRICSGKYTRGMKVLHVRSGKTLALNNPVLFLARERELAEEAWPGDILGIPGHGHLRIGDSLTEGEALYFTGIPNFAPELFQRIRLEDPLRSKQLKAALEQLSEEGASQIFKPLDGSAWIIGVVGALQFDVIASRIAGEYGVKGSFEAVSYTAARWIKAKDQKSLDEFCSKNKYNTAEDASGQLAYLAPNAWHLERIQKDFPEIEFMKTRENR
ncbi:MAG: peptide chain release factor 3 [Rickettsiales bacterium]|jgi:peptide chain release factor 3|nr:peptide chain release factor 3 [Rickettsiales bacterium]